MYGCPGGLSWCTGGGRSKGRPFVPRRLARRLRAYRPGRAARRDPWRVARPEVRVARCQLTQPVGMTGLPAQLVGWLPETLEPAALKGVVV